MFIWFVQISEYILNFIFDDFTFKKINWIIQVNCDWKDVIISFIKVVVVPKISLWKTEFFYDFKTGNYIISRVICKERHSF